VHRGFGCCNLASDDFGSAIKKNAPGPRARAFRLGAAAVRQAVREPEELTDWRDAPAARRAEWFRYYSEKRIGHQWLQVHLLKDLQVESVLEIGPNLGLVTALLENAGFRPTTLDIRPPQDPNSRAPHIQADLLEVAPERLAGFDAILCCETLEHLPWASVGPVLARLRAAAPRHLVVSVPYQGFQLDVRLHLTLRSARQWFSLKWPRFWRDFRFDPEADPWGHKWEVGYRGRGLGDVETKLAAAGWRIRRRTFTSPTRSVFWLLDPG
jgi:hypothetical protein